jgi:uncharacterized protein YggE
MKTLATLAILAAALLTGCTNSQATQRNEEERQHHLYALQGCVAETIQADKSLLSMSVQMTAQDMQAGHNYRAAECMAAQEKTTVEYQYAKHDDYGKVPTL